MSRTGWLSITLLLAVACGEAKAPAPPPPAATPPPAAAAPSPAFDAVAEAAASYRVAASIAPEALKSGEKGQLALTIEMTRPDVHVQAEFPLKVSLSGSPGLAPAKGTLAHADAVDPAAKGRRWNVGVTAAGKGAQRVDAALRFAICKETEPAWCVVRSETVGAAVEVR